MVERIAAARTGIQPIAQPAETGTAVDHPVKDSQLVTKITLEHHYSIVDRLRALAHHLHGPHATDQS